MRLRWCACVGLIALAEAGMAWSQDLNFRASAPRKIPAASTVDPIPVSLSRPRPAGQVSSSRIPAPENDHEAARGTPLFRGIVRGQMADTTPTIPIPQPPPFPGSAPSPIGGPARPTAFPGGTSAPTSGVKGNEEDYNCGRINNDADQGSFFTRTGEKFSRCWTDVTDGVSGGFAGTGGRSRFQSDDKFNVFISPVSNPHFFEDPRALTEFRPVFIWQKTPSSNYIFQGGNNYAFDLQGRVAFTENLSIVMNRLGWVWNDVGAPQQGIQSGNGFSEFHIGPKFTFIRNEASNTVAALGLNFEVPIGSSKVNQDTGTLSLSPYFSIAQNFGKSDYGSFNFMNTTGYSVSVDSQRTDFLYASFHLDYDVGNAKKFFPLVELNWTYYAMNGSARDVGFEGSNLYNFGSAGVAGHNDLTVAIGARYKVSEAIQFGLTGEMSVLGSGGGRYLDNFRLTADMIFRY